MRLLLAVLFTFSGFAWADDGGEYLDPAYTHHQHPTPLGKEYRPFGERARSLKAVRSDTVSLIKKQTPVRSQMARGTCSIFSATAILEAMLVIKKGFETDLDLSEEWLQYLVNRNSMSDGSSSYRNFSAFFQWGSTYEELLPYIGEDWTEVPSVLAEQRCGKMDQWRKTSCLIVHRDPTLLDLEEKELTTLDPEFLKARVASFQLRDEFIKSSGDIYTIYDTDTVKALLKQGIPVTLDVDFFYGAWNHRRTDSLGIPRNLDHWNKGIVGYPLAGSVDRINSRKEPAGHSIVLVGYDDEVEVELEHLMPSGEVIKKKYKGVYYFKNSWGTDKLGAQFTLDDQKFPGYGMITQKYAEELGTFFQLPLE